MPAPGVALAVLLGAFAGGAAAAGEFATLKGHGGPVMAIAVAPDGAVATASFDNAVGLWARDDGSAAPRWLDGHRAAVNAVVFLGPDRIVSGGDDARVLVWDLRGAEDPAELHRHAAKVAALALSPDGRTLATASWDGSVALIDLAGGGARRLDGHGGPVSAVAFSPDGSRLYSGGADGALLVWSLPGAAAPRALLRHGFGINEIVLPRDGAWLAYGAVDGATRVIDPESGALIADFTPGRRPVLALAHSGVAGQLAVGDGEGYILLIDTADWSVAKDFRATRDGPVWALAFSPDGGNVLAGGLEPLVYSWPRDAMADHGPMAGGPQAFQRDPSEMGNGERQFARKCSICHTLTEGSARRAGPSLHAVFGREAGSVPDYSYSETLRRSDIVWTETTIDALFGQGPDHFIPGSKMPMQVIAEARDRADLIAYLRDATAPRREE